jgi:hypothetical protein
MVQKGVSEAAPILFGKELIFLHPFLPCIKGRNYECREV